MEEKYCESCGMPLTEPEELGTDENGSLSQEYCIYCYRDGKFTQDVTMEQMIEISLRHLDELDVYEENDITREEALESMRAFFPKLKRWRN